MRRVLIPVASLGLSILGLLPAASAQADSVTALPISSFYQVVADTAHGHLFISQGSSSVNEILVTDLAGKEVTAIAGQNGVKGIALSPDGNTLYAALGASHAVTAIDTATLQQTASYPVGDANTPVDVAVQSGKIWVSYGTGTAGQAAIGDVDLSETTPSFHPQASLGNWYNAPQLAADPQDTGVLVAAEPGMDPSSVASYDVTTDPPAVRASSAFFQNCDNEQSLAVAPGGAQFVLACGSPHAHYRYSTADLSQQGSYASAAFPDAVAIDANGDVAAGTENDQSSPDIYVYHQDGNAALNTYNLAASGANLVGRGVAWLADGSKLFAVLENSNSAYSLRVLDGPMITNSSLTLGGPSAVNLSKSLTLTGTLSLSIGTPPAGSPITVTRTVAGGTGTKTFSLSTAADGSFTLTDTPPAPGKYTYTASYSGTSTTKPAQATHTVTVNRIPVSLNIATGGTTFTYEPTVHVTAHLGTTATNRTLSIYAQRFGSKARRLLKTGKVDAHGNLAVSYRAPHSTKFIAVFTGDARYAPKTVTRSVNIRAKVSESLSGYYGHTRTGGHTYWLFHRHHLMYVNTTVAPNKAKQCVKFEVQEHYRGAWRANVTTSCVRLSSRSTITAAFGLTHANLGYHYRIRADYIRNRTDVTNLSNHSGWQYLIVRS